MPAMVVTGDGVVTASGTGEGANEAAFVASTTWFTYCTVDTDMIYVRLAAGLSDA